MPRFNSYPTPEDKSGDDSIQYLPPQDAMEAADESLVGQSSEGLDDDNAATRHFERAAQIDLPRIIDGTGPYRKL